MTRIPLDVIELEYGEDARYSPPAGADRWSAFGRTDLMPPLNNEPSGNRNITHGGTPPQWAMIGTWNITADEFIPPSETAGQPRAPATGFEDVASAAGFTATWETLAAAAATGLREALMVIAYVDGKATHKTIIRTPPVSAIDPTVISAQERRLLQSLLLTRDQRAGSGGIIKHDHGEGSGEEYESLAVLDRRISEVRARIAWFEQAADGNDTPGASWAGLSTETDRTSTTVAATPPPDPDIGTTVMRAAFSPTLPFADNNFRWIGTVNSIELDSSWSQPASFGIWLPGDLWSLVVEIVLLRSIQTGQHPDVVNIAAFEPAIPYRFGNTDGLLRHTAVTFQGNFSLPNDIRAVIGEVR